MTIWEDGDVDGSQARFEDGNRTAPSSHPKLVLKMIVTVVDEHNLMQQ